MSYFKINHFNCIQPFFYLQLLWSALKIVSDQYLRQAFWMIICTMFIKIKCILNN